MDMRCFPWYSEQLWQKCSNNIQPHLETHEIGSNVSSTEFTLVAQKVYGEYSQKEQGFKAAGFLDIVWSLGRVPSEREPTGLGSCQVSQDSHRLFSASCAASLVKLAPEIATTTEERSVHRNALQFSQAASARIPKPPCLEAPFVREELCRTGQPD